MTEAEKKRSQEKIRKICALSPVHVPVGWFNMDPDTGYRLQDGTEAMVVFGDPKEAEVSPNYAETAKQGIWVPADFWCIMCYLVVGQEFRFTRSVIPRWNEVLKQHEPQAYPFLKINELPPEDQDYVFGATRSPELIAKMTELAKAMNVPPVPQVIGDPVIYDQYVALFQAARKALSQPTFELRGDMFGGGKSGVHLN